MEFYLGSAALPRPFGGRDTEIAQLNQWLTDPLASPAMLVAAPAGRGKSALLVRWIDQLETGFHTVFLPISIRYETNLNALFYQALAARLADILSEKLPPAPAEPAQYYREKVIEFSARIEQERLPTLIVIDGLDEAAGWHFDPGIFSLRINGCIKVLVSARVLAGDDGTSDWLRRLNWSVPPGFAHVVEPKPIGRAGISEVLLSMGCPLDTLAADVDIVGELHRLTEGGDPLLLELYVTDLWSRGQGASRLRPADLTHLKPGYSDYFKRWFNEQSRIWQATGAHFPLEVVDGVLVVLACAMGPLKFTELEALIFEVLPNKQLFSKETLAPLQRFIVGDGQNAGFALAHPKLADFLRNERFANGRSVDKAEDAFLNWCQGIVRALNTGEMSPDRAPEYALLYYTQHLAVRGAVRHVAQYRELLEDGWRKAWAALTNGEQGFARDVKAALDALRDYGRVDPEHLKEPQVGLGGQLRALLCLGSINSLGSGVNANVLGELYKLQMVSLKEVMTLTRVKNPYEQVQVFHDIAHDLTEDYAAEAYTILRNIVENDDVYDTLTILMKVIPRLPDHMRITALAYAEQQLIEEDSEFTVTRTLEDVSDLLPEGFSRRVHDARAARDRELQNKQSIDPTNLSAYIKRADEYELNDRSREFLDRVFDGNRDPATLLSEALSHYSKYTDTYSAAYDAQSFMIAALQRFGDDVFDQISRFITDNLVSSSHSLSDTLKTILPNVSVKRRKELVQIAFEHLDEFDAPRFFSDIEDIYPISGPSDVLSDPEAINQTSVRVSVVTKIPSALPLPFLKEMLENLHEIDVWDRQDIVRSIGPYLDPPLRRLALRRINELGSDFDRSYQLVELAPFLSDDELPRLEETMQAMQDMSDRGRVLAALMPLYRQRGMKLKVADIRKLAFTIGGEDKALMAKLSLTWDSADIGIEDLMRIQQASQKPVVGSIGFAETLMSTLLVVTLPPDQRTGALVDAQSKARAIPGNRDKVFALALVAALCPSGDRFAAVGEVLDVLETTIAGGDVDENFYFLQLFPLISPFCSDAQFARLEKMATRLTEAALQATTKDEDLGLDWAQFGMETRLRPSPEELLDYLQKAPASNWRDNEKSTFLVMQCFALVLCPKLPRLETAKSLTQLQGHVERFSTDPYAGAIIYAMLLTVTEEQMLIDTLDKMISNAVNLPRSVVLDAILVMNGILTKYFETAFGDDMVGAQGHALQRAGGEATINELRKSLSDIGKWYP